MKSSTLLLFLVACSSESTPQTTKESADAGQQDATSDAPVDETGPPLRPSVNPDSVTEGLPQCNDKKECDDKNKHCAHIRSDYFCVVDACANVTCPSGYSCLRLGTVPESIVCD